MITPKRRDNDDGTTVWTVRFRYGQSKKNPDKPKQTAELFTSEAKAKAFAGWLDALGPQGALDMLYDSERVADVPTLNAVAADHIEHLTGIEEGTRKKYTSLWARTWGERIGSLPANAWGPDNVRSALNDLANSYAPKSLQNQRGLLSGVADRCVEKGYLLKSPTRGMRLPQGRHVEIGEDDDDDHEMVCLTYDEWGRLYECTAEHYRPFVRFLVGTGCRYGEVVVLRVKDFDLDKKIVRIRRGLKWSPDGKHTIGPPKTKRGRRTVTLPPELIADVRPMLMGKRAEEIVFTAPRGGMINHRTFWSKAWRPAIWRAQRCAEHLEPECKCGTGEPHRCRLHGKRYGGTGVPESCGCEGTLKQTPRIHDLRHTHASWLLAQGKPVHVVSARLGHRDPSVTWRIYTHLLPDSQVDAAAGLSLAFAGGPLQLDVS